MSAWELEKELTPKLQSSDLDYCAEHVSNKIKSYPKSPFHLILDLSFTNEIVDVAKFFQKFVDDTRPKELKAIYTETNGFSINPECWFFDLFGFKSYGGHKDYDWLSDYEFESDYPGMTLTGMEDLQKVYASDAFRNPKYREGRGYCDLLVVINFQKLIRDSAPLIKNLDVPILATSHDYDFIYEYSR